MKREKRRAKGEEKSEERRRDMLVEREERVEKNEKR